MDKIIQQSVPVIGVIAGQRATVDYPIGPRYHALHFIFTATGAEHKTVTLADVAGLIRVLINGRVQREFLATELDAIQTAYSAFHSVNIYKAGTRDAAEAAGAAEVHLVINLSEPWRKSSAATEFLAWPTAWANGKTLQSLQLTIDLPDTGNLAAGTLAVQAWVEQDSMLGAVDAQNNEVTRITKWYRNVVQYSGPGDLVVSNLVRKDVCLQLTAFTQAGDPLGNVKVKVDNQIKRDATKKMLEQSLVNREWNPDALSDNRLDIAFDYTDNFLDGLNLNGVADYQLTLTVVTGTAATKLITLIDQRYGPID